MICCSHRSYHTCCMSTNLLGGYLQSMHWEIIVGGTMRHQTSGRRSHDYGNWIHVRWRLWNTLKVYDRCRCSRVHNSNACLVSNEITRWGRVTSRSRSLISNWSPSSNSMNWCWMWSRWAKHAICLWSCLRWRSRWLVRSWNSVLA